MSTFSAKPQSQHGVALIVALLMLLILSLLAVASVDKVNVSEKIAGNQRDLNSAFQAAEAALLEGERWVENPPGGIVLTPPAVSTNCAGAACATAVWDTVDNNPPLINDSVLTESGALEVWRDINWTAKGRQFSVDGGGAGIDGAPMPGLAANPRYFIEFLGTSGAGTVADPTLFYFRITARAVGVTPNSEVILQSIFRRT